MKTSCYRILVQIFAINMWGLAVIGTILFVSGIVGWIGYLPESTSLNMMGNEIESIDDYKAFVVFTAAFSAVGWIYVILRVSGHLQYRRQQPAEQGGDSDEEEAV